MAFGLEGISLITIIQSVLLVISALLIIIAAIGILRMDNDMPNVVYARIHILGMVDVAGIIAFIALGQPLFALIYLFLAPLLAHALANGYYHGEDDYNNPVLNPDLLIEDPYNLNKDSDSGSESDDSSENISNLEEYIQNCNNNNFEKNTILEEVQDKNLQMNEYMILGLRKINGISIQQFENKFNENPIMLYKEQFQKLNRENLIIIDGDIIKLSNKGLDLANLVWEEFV